MSEARNPNVSPHPGAGGGEPRYKIGDVCRIADVQPYVLRYWESEFPALSPDRTLQGPRTYSVRELRIIEQIKKLLYDEGYTIAGAKKKLEAELGGREVLAPPSVATPEPRSKGEAARPREKAATEPKARPAKPAPELTELPFPDAPAPAETAPIRTTAAAPPAPDARVGRAVSELKEILKLLSRR